MPLSQSPHIHDQYETGSHLSSRTTPSSESDSRAPNGSRKRVPVAVRFEPVQPPTMIASLTEYSVKDVENVRSSAAVMRATVRLVPIARTPARKNHADFFEYVSESC